MTDRPSFDLPEFLPNFGVMKHIRDYIPDLLLIIIFITDVFIATVSNYTESRFVLKAVSTLLLILTVWYNYRRYNFNHPQDTIKFFEGTKQANFILGAMTCVFAVSLLWSSNAGYGALKLLNFVLSTVPAVYVLHYIFRLIVKKQQSSLVDIFIYFSVAASFISIPLILYIQPFDYLGSFTITLTKWSHVIYGRFVSSVFVIMMLMMLTEKTRKRTRILLAGVFFSGLGILISGYRGGAAACAGITVLIIIYLLAVRRLPVYNLAAVIVTLLLTGLTASAIFYTNNTLASRYSVMEDYEEMDFGGDSSIHTHLAAYDDAMEMFYDSPVLGEGFGSFKNYKGNKLMDFAGYPHNIFLEFAAELGGAGLILFLVLLAVIFYYSWKADPAVFFFFFFALLLAQFSKDISSNTLLWMGCGAAGWRRESGVVSK
jgi:O-antigen ligase